MKRVIRGLILTKVLESLREPKQEKEGKVFFSKLFAGLGVVVSAIFLIPTIVTVCLDEPLWVPISFSLFTLLGASFLVAYTNCRISYDQDGFVHKSFFGIKRKFTYEQVTAIKENQHETFIYLGKRRIVVDEFAIGGDRFIKLVKKKYRTMHDGESIPKIKAKYDIFNGNVRGSGGFLFAFGTMLVILIGVLIFTIYCVYFTPSTPNNTTEQSVDFVSCNIIGGDVELTSADNRIYEIRYVGEIFDTKDISDLCNGKQEVTVFSEEITPNNAETYYLVKAIKHNDKYILSFEETNKFYRQENTPLVVIAAVMCFLWVVLSIFYIIVGRNPHKFSKRIVRALFKDGYIKY